MRILTTCCKTTLIMVRVATAKSGLLRCTQFPPVEISLLMSAQLSIFVVPKSSPPSQFGKDYSTRPMNLFFPVPCFFNQLSSPV